MQRNADKIKRKRFVLETVTPSIPDAIEFKNKGYSCCLATAAAVLWLSSGCAMKSGPDTSMMPQNTDYSHCWWAEGFPSHTPTAPWLRVIQTGRYAMAMNTETLAIPHFGEIETEKGYAAAAEADNRSWQALPPAQLSMTMTVDNTSYHCRRGTKWGDNRGPMLVESGRYMQRTLLSDLDFTTDDGKRLNVEACLETVAWPERLSLVLTAKPEAPPIPAGEICFGKINGGFGLDGKNHLEIPHAANLEPENFTLALWVYLPQGAQPSFMPWLVCKNGNEWVEGNYGIGLDANRPKAIMNIGGGPKNNFSFTGNKAMEYAKWNHLAMTYDGKMLRLYVNGESAGKREIGKPRIPGTAPLALGRRQDNANDGYHFYGVLDEIKLYDRALTKEAIKSVAARPHDPLADATPVGQWSFSQEVQAADSQPASAWQQAAMTIQLTSANGTVSQSWQLPPGQGWDHNQRHEVAIDVSPKNGDAPVGSPALAITAQALPGGPVCPVISDPHRNWHRIDLGNIPPIIPVGNEPERRNNAMERIRLTLHNPDTVERTARLFFDKKGEDMKIEIGSPITGVSAILRDADGNPTGIPVQISKNFHGRPTTGIYNGTWFHGFSEIRLPAETTRELELTIVYGHWGGVAAASHAQLCLIGWGSNQLWDQSALGAWGENICYEPDQAQAACAVLDVRPVLVNNMHNNGLWNWTHNVGGGDFFRIFAPDKNRLFPARMKTAYLRQCPVLTEVTYAGHTANALEHQATVSIYRSDDIVRGIYRLRLQVTKPVDFSRFVIFQIGADTYSYTSERKMAIGNESGLSREWETQWGGDHYKTQPMQCVGRIPWVSLHQAVKSTEENGAWANRGIVIREWSARLGGKEAAPWAAEYGVEARGKPTSTIDIIPPPDVKQLMPGDFIEATFEHIIMPQYASDYYGPNTNLRAALAKGENTWNPIYREALGNDRQVEVTTGHLETNRPAVRVQADRHNQAAFTLTGGLGYVPVTIAGLSDYRKPVLEVSDTDGNWQPINQAVHGNDFWQCDYQPNSNTWELTFSVPVDSNDDQKALRHYRFKLATTTLGYKHRS